ncbi:MAG: hypothetical protein ABJJ44_06615 [Paraglaciecola sp.]|uniref:hypothetical protein n=1 Tax=Paraglaciecola sp. TaxID=1920173 RepID=UPI003299168F
MKYLCKLVIVITLVITTGCTSLLGVTGANEGVVVDDKWMKYDVKHPWLTITIIEPFSNELLPISTVGKSSPSPLRHTVIFGKKSNPHTFEIIGKYQKDLYLDGQFYGSIWSGVIIIKDGTLIIDTVRVSPRKEN